MKIGLDFDNTIVCYDALFHTLAQERGLIPPETAISKGAVRDALRAVGHEETWIVMQGEVYGARITEAPPFPGVKSFFRQAAARGIELAIISHKTRHPFRGPRYDLHQAARDWLHFHGFIAGTAPLLNEAAVYLELTKEAKWERIQALNCDYFIDDLPEFLGGEGFPPTTRPLLFDPADIFPETGFQRFKHWQAIEVWLKDFPHLSEKGV